MSATRLPTEVELAYEVMPCLAQRTSSEPVRQPHACTYFRKWGTYHSYDYAVDGPPTSPGIEHDAVYRGRATVVPEMVSGCRKAPILAVGINPNLPGWWANRRNAVVPLFDEVKQFAHYFRYRTIDKLEVPPARYSAFGGGPEDTPLGAFEINVPAEPDGSRSIPLRTAPQTMYEGYQSLLDGLADAMGWVGHRLSVGEDWAYGNMVACASAKWSTSNETDFPAMTVGERDGIVTECFHKRRYFLRQLFQSLPSVIFVFSQATAKAFISELQGRFVAGDPQPNDSLTVLRNKTVRLKYGQLADGTMLRARVIFSPHVSGSPTEFAAARPGLIAKLKEEADAGHLTLNPATGHLRRPRGGCVFCPMLEIGPCDYEAELTPIADHPALATDDQPVMDPASEKRIQLSLLDDLPPPQITSGWDLDDDPIDAPGPSATSTAERLAVAPAQLGQLLAGEVDPDVGPTFVLRGRIVPMTTAGAVIPDGRIVISKGLIRAVQPASSALPTEFATAPEHATGGTIYPGLIDLHNHFVYNVLPLWKVPRKYNNRSQWPSHPEYKSNVSKPIREALGKYTWSALAVIRYVEAKALIGGTTTGQGIRTRTAAGNRAMRGAMRNVEETLDSRLPAAGTMVPNLGSGAEQIQDFRDALARRQAYFYHLSEGVDNSAHRHFENLQLNGLIKPPLVGIHSLALKDADLSAMADVGAKVVWSPYSNRLLYGETISPSRLKRAGVPFAIGCDWSPTGSRNLLQELKVADFENRADGSPFRDFDLVAAVTKVAAEVVSWGNFLGVLAPGKMADLLVLGGASGDPYRMLIEARESDVALLTVHGIVRYGNRMLVRRVHSGTAADLENVDVASVEKCFHLKSSEPILNGVSFAEAVDRLNTAMSDLPAHIARMEASGGGLLAMGLTPGQAITLDADNEYDEEAFDPLTEYPSQPTLLADVPMATTVELDGVAVLGDAAYLAAVANENNLSQSLKDHLAAAYR